MPSDDKYMFLEKALDNRKANGQFRELNTVVPRSSGLSIGKNKKEYINFSSNDYLGLAHHPEVKKRARQYTEKYGAGSTASRLITGTYDIHTALESSIADAMNKEAALVFNSGFQANSSLLGTLTDRHSLIIADKLSHSSLLQGALASRADFQRFDHNDTEHLKSLLKKAQGSYNRIWIVTETVFSMDGDRSPVEEIAAIADAYDALLYVDDAHAVGVWGDQGLGLAKDIEGIDLLLGTCGKAFGSFGAYVACSEQMKSYLVNYCPGFIFTTALPPSVIGATAAALEQIPKMDAGREAYHDRISTIRSELEALGFDTGPSTTQIIPLIIGSEEETLHLSEYLKERGMIATAIRPPTVPEGSARIRLAIASHHTDTQIDHLLNVLKNWKNE